MLNKKVEINFLNNDGKGFFNIVCEYGYGDIVGLLLDRGVDVNYLW